MSERITAVLDQIEARRQEPLLPEGVMALPLLQMAYRGQVKLTVALGPLNGCGRALCRGPTHISLFGHR
jgi:hypothetical protein